MKPPVLHYAASHHDAQSVWGVVALLAAGGGILLLLSIAGVNGFFGKAGAAGTPEWTKAFVVGLLCGAVAFFAAGTVSGIFGLAQRTHRREWAAFGVFCNCCLLAVLAEVR